MMPAPRAVEVSFGENDTSAKGNMEEGKEVATGNNQQYDPNAPNAAIEGLEQPQMFSAEQLNAAVQAAVEQARWSDINFSAYTQMLRPIYDLPHVEELSDRAIDIIMDAIQHVMYDCSMLLEIISNNYSG